MRRGRRRGMMRRMRRRMRRRRRRGRRRRRRRGCDSPVSITLTIRQERRRRLG